MGYSLTRFFHGGRLAAAAFLIFLLALPGPATAALGEFTIKDEVELGKQIKASIRSSMPLVDDPEVVAYIQEVMDRLMATTPPQPFEYSISVVRHNAINAFATPGGNLFLFTGLILAMDHESEMAGVLAHEIAHATQRHIAGRIAQMQKISLLSMAGAVMGALLGRDAGQALMVGSLAGGQAAQLSYSRADESDADHVGMRYLVQAGYPPRGMVGAFEKLRQQQRLFGSNIPTYLATHPALQDRITGLTTRINTMAPDVRNRKNDDVKFKRIQTLLRARYSDPDRALAEFARQKQLPGPERCLAMMGEGIVHAEYNRVRDAEAAFEAALQCGPQESLIHREAGLFHYLKGSKDKASSLLTRALQLNPRDYMALFFYARIQADSGDLRGSQRNFQRILTDLRDDPEVHYFYAQVLGRDNQMFRAHLHLAYSSLYANDRAKTRQNYDRAKKAATTPQDNADLKRFEALLKEREQLFGQK